MNQFSQLQQILAAQNQQQLPIAPFPPLPTARPNPQHLMQQQITEQMRLQQQQQQQQIQKAQSEQKK
jgi:hypothetical protein